MYILCFNKIHLPTEPNDFAADNKLLLMNHIVKNQPMYYKYIQYIYIYVTGYSVCTYKL